MYAVSKYSSNYAFQLWVNNSSSPISRKLNFFSTFERLLKQGEARIDIFRSKLYAAFKNHHSIKTWNGREKFIYAHIIDWSLGQMSSECPLGHVIRDGLIKQYIGFYFK